MQDKNNENEQAVLQPLPIVTLQGKLSEDEKSFVRGLSNYAKYVNEELLVMGFQKVKPTIVHQVVGGFCSNSAIEVASRRIIKRFQALQ